MTLARIELTDFRGFRKLSLDFHREMTVLVGPNGSGKSTILAAIVAAKLGQWSPRDTRVGTEGALLRATSDDGDVYSVGMNVMIPSHFRKWIETAFILNYGVQRSAIDQTPGSTLGNSWTSEMASSQWDHAGQAYGEFFHWFREMEDLENERIAHSESAFYPQLDAVRDAVTSFMGDYKNLRVRRQLPPISMQPVLTLEKGGDVLPFDAFSDGERNTVALVADIARRLALLGSDRIPPENPLEQSGIVLIDEIELHLHPAWQRRFIRQLPKTFPGLQFIITTQSPVIVSEVSADSLRVLRDFQLVDPHHHRGSDANSILEETFETKARPDEIVQQLDSLADHLDDRKLKEAAPLLEALRSTLGDGDPDVVYYRNIFNRLSRADG